MFENVEIVEFSEGKWKGTWHVFAPARGKEDVYLRTSTPKMFGVMKRTKQEVEQVLAEQREIAKLLSPLEYCEAAVWEGSVFSPITKAAP